MSHVERYDDDYARYVAVRLAAQRGEAEKNRVIRSLWWGRPRGLEDRNVNLFSFTSGALAIHESLQREQWLGEFRLSLDTEPYWPDRQEADSVGESQLGDGGPAIKAILFGPLGVSVDADEKLLVAEVGNNRIRRIDPGIRCFEWINRSH